MKEIQYEDYEEGSWDEFDRTLTAHHFGTSRHDRDTFLPSPEEIQQRIAMMNWLKENSFSTRFLTCVMRFDSPDFVEVQRLTRKVGADEAERRLIHQTIGFPEGR